MATRAKDTYRLKPVAPHRSDPPGTVTEMPPPSLDRESRLGKTLICLGLME